MSPRSQDIKQSGLFGFLAQPDAPTKAGVVLLPTIFGVNAFARGYAETLARAGLAAAVWDHYDGLPLTTDYEEAKKRGRTLTDPKMRWRSPPRSPAQCWWYSPATTTSPARKPTRRSSKR